MECLGSSSELAASSLEVSARTRQFRILLPTHLRFPHRRLIVLALALVAFFLCMGCAENKTASVPDEARGTTGASSTVAASTDAPQTTASSGPAGPGDLPSESVCFLLTPEDVTKAVRFAVSVARPDALGGGCVYSYDDDSAASVVVNATANGQQDFENVATVIRDGKLGTSIRDDLSSGSRAIFTSDALEGALQRRSGQTTAGGIELVGATMIEAEVVYPSPNDLEPGRAVVERVPGLLDAIADAVARSPEEFSAPSPSRTDPQERAAAIGACLRRENFTAAIGGADAGSEDFPTSGFVGVSLADNGIIIRTFERAEDAQQVADQIRQGAPQGYVRVVDAALIVADPLDRAIEAAVIGCIS